MNWTIQNLWLIPALPLLAAGLTALARQPQRRFAASLAIGSMIISFLLSCAAFAHTLSVHEGGAKEVRNFDWFVLGQATLKLGWVLDPLTAAMLVMVTFVGALIFIYSVGYMAHDENFTRFFCFLSLFAAAMLGLVIANSLLMLFMCWELVGLASYLLIGFWYHKPSAAAAATKAFITTRVGDIGFFMGVLWLYAETGTLLFYDGGNGCLETSALTKLVGQLTIGGMAVSTAVSLLIFCGAIGKSGQVPLHVWLPDAMEGPTPVSALIHAATMVAAGVFLVARVYPLMEAAPGQPVAAAQVRFGQTLTPALSLSERERENQRRPSQGSQGVEPLPTQQNRELRTAPLPLPGGEGRGEGTVSSALQTVTWIGAITAVFAALIAVAQTDIKRILAYSTVSQLGYMMIGLGVGGVAVGIFHLITHAFFKALLFLGAGSVIHGCQEEQDIRRMGGLKKFMPVTFATYAVGMMALSGVPLLFSGFWSKDEILHAASLWQRSKIPFLLGIVGTFLTAFYMTRQMCYVFFGTNRSRGGHEMERSARSPEETNPPHHVGGYQAHESPHVMTFPLIILAVCTILLSLFGTPVWPWFESYLNGHAATFDFSRLIESSTLKTMLLSIVIVTLGIAAAGWLYGKPISIASTTDPLARLQPGVFAVFANKFYIDELYRASVIRLTDALALFAHWLDRFVWGGIVKAVSLVALGISWIDRFIDEYVVNLGFDESCENVRRSSGLVSRLQSGQIQKYLSVIGVALTVLVLMLIWGCRQ